MTLGSDWVETGFTVRFLCKPVKMTVSSSLKIAIFTPTVDGGVHLMGLVTIKRNHNGYDMKRHRPGTKKLIV